MVAAISNLASVCADKGFDRVDPGTFQYVSVPCAIMLLGSDYPPEAALMKYLQPRMVLLLSEISNFTSVKQYCEKCSFVYSNLSVGLNIVVLLNIAQLAKSTRSFLDLS